MTKPPKMTAQQEAFVRFLAADIRGRQAEAARKAGYSPKVADNRARDLLAKPHIREAYQALVKARLARCDIDKDWVLDRLHAIADADPRIVDLDPEEMTPRELAAVSHFKKVALNDGSGRVVTVAVLCNKQDALMQIAKIEGMITKKSEVKLDISIAAERAAEESFMGRLAKLAESQRTKEILGLPPATGEADPPA